MAAVELDTTLTDDPGDGHGPESLTGSVYDDATSEPASVFATPASRVHTDDDWSDPATDVSTQTTVTTDALDGKDPNDQHKHLHRIESVYNDALDSLPTISEASQADAIRRAIDEESTHEQSPISSLRTVKSMGNFGREFSTPTAAATPSIFRSRSKDKEAIQQVQFIEPEYDVFKTPMASQHSTDDLIASILHSADGQPWDQLERTADLSFNSRPSFDRSHTSHPTMQSKSSSASSFAREASRFPHFLSDKSLDSNASGSSFGKQYSAFPRSQTKLDTSEFDKYVRATSYVPYCNCLFLECGSPGSECER